MAFSSTNPACRTQTSASSPLPKPYRSSSFIIPSQLIYKSVRFTSCPSKSPSISCVFTAQPPHLMGEENKDKDLEPLVLQRPDSFGRFGKFGGKFVPETLMYALTELESAFKALAGDQDFQVPLVLLSFISC